MKYSFVKTYYQGEKGYLFLEEIIQRRYWENNILAPGTRLEDKPNILISLQTRTNVLATFGIFTEDIPSKKIFSFSVSSPIVELGRLTLCKQLSLVEKSIALKRVFRETAHFLRIFYPQRKIIFTTPPRIKGWIEFIYKKEVFIERKAKIKKRKIPPQSTSFYLQKKPKVYQVKSLVYFL